jgi:protein TonB
MVRLFGMALDLRQRSAAVSVAVHALVCVMLLGSWHFARKVTVVQRLPGTAAGTQLTLNYSPGGASPAATTALKAPSALPSPAKQAKAAKPVPSTANAAAPGAGTSGQSSLGDGDISIALVRTHPRPAPDLSGLPHGTAGDVVLDVVIDADGRIADAKVERGLGGAIDQTVLAFVREQWTFAPATRNGVAIASEQELLFHYERG